jgi:hypothetical protein
MVSGWRDSNPRPLRPERAYSVTTSIKGCRHVLAGRRIVCSGGIACQWVADFLLTPFGLAPWPSRLTGVAVSCAKDSTETAGTSRGGAVRTRRGTWSCDG